MTASRSILLIEDDEGIRETVAECLASEGYDVAPVANGKEGLDWLQASRPDLIMVDLSMPVMNGAQFIEQLRGDDDLRTIPVVLMTAASQNHAEGIAGADAYLPKPFELGDLIDTIERHVRS